MMPLTADRPKPMVAVAGKPMIDHARALAADAGVTKLVSNLHYKAEVLESHLANTNVQTLRETPDILDTGGGLRNALPLLGAGPVWTVNPDAMWNGPNPLGVALDHWDPDRMDALLVCIDPAQAWGSDSAGDFTLGADGRLKRGPGLLYGGVQIVRPDRLHDIPDTSFSLNLLWDQLIADGRCFGCRYPGTWCDVGHPSGIALAEQMLDWHPDD